MSLPDDDLPWKSNFVVRTKKMICSSGNDVRKKISTGTQRNPYYGERLFGVECNKHKAQSDVHADADPR